MATMADKYKNDEAYEYIKDWKIPVDVSVLAKSVDAILDDCNGIDGLKMATDDKRLAALALAITYVVERANQAKEIAMKITGESEEETSRANSALEQYANRIITGEVAWLMKKYASGAPIFK